MSKNQEYIQQYAEYAMEQMRRYGIPASVTLAQGICESASGQSELSRKGNNHFGIKATSSWIENGGKYLVYTDDRPNEMQQPFRILSRRTDCKNMTRW